MSLPGLVLVHGGAHAADSWDLVVDELAALAPQLRVLAVDLPGRRGNPVTVADCVNSVVADVENAGFSDVIVAGHSLAGVTVPGVVAKLGHPRVREMILIAAFVAPQGSTVVNTLRGPLAPLARFGASVRTPSRMPMALAHFAFWNGMTRDQRRFAASRLCGDSLSVITEPVDRSELPQQVPRTWVLTLRDRALAPRRQRAYIDELGGVDTVVCVDACHDVMFSHPKRLARILADRCQLRV